LRLKKIRKGYNLIGVLALFIFWILDLKFQNSKSKIKMAPALHYPNGEPFVNRRFDYSINLRIE
jgi:hypothetical protein